MDQWWSAVFDDHYGTVKPENLISLSPTAHKMHTQGHFALEPVGLDPDRKRLTLCFWWLKQGQSAEKVAVSDFPGLTAAYDRQGDRIGLLNMHTRQHGQLHRVFIESRVTAVCHSYSVESQ